MVNESFWDLYFKRPCDTTNIKSEAIKEWFSFTNLSVPRINPEDAETSAPDVKAIVRLRIPVIDPPKKEEDELEEGKS